MNRGDWALPTLAAFAAGETPRVRGESSFSPRRYLSQLIVRKAQRERQRQPRVIVTLGDWIVGSLTDEVPLE